MPSADWGFKPLKLHKNFCKCAETISAHSKEVESKALNSLGVITKNCLTLNFLTFLNSFHLPPSPTQIRVNGKAVFVCSGILSSKNAKIYEFNITCI